MIREMRTGDLDDVVRIHLAAFPNFFLSFLGPRFLREFYTATIRDGVALVATSEDRVTGFVAGVTQSQSFYRRLLRRRFIPVSLALVAPALRRPSTLLRVFKRATSRTIGTTPEGAELMSLAVDPAQQRRGEGRALVEAFAAEVRRRGATRLWLTTDANENERVKTFYEGLAFTPSRSYTTDEGRALVEYSRDAQPFIPFARPDIGDAEIDAVTAVLRSGWLTTGERTHEFEKRFADFVGAKHAIALNSCTAALHLALEAIGVATDDEVIVPDYTFAATAEVVMYFGARPVIVDVDPRTLNIDPARVAEKITAKTKAIIPVHIGGFPADLDAIRAVAGDIPIIEDAAHSLPTRYKGRLIGSISDFTCFSFYATKTITTGEGGMLCTDDDERAKHVRVMALHGISHDAWNRYRAEGSWYYEVVAPGFKYNMTDVAAALGLSQLTKVIAMRERRQQIAAQYDAAFAGDARFDLPAHEDPHDHAWHLYPLRLNGLDRAKFIASMRESGVGTSVHFIPLHRHPFYRDRFGLTDADFPVSTREYEREVSIPIYNLMSDGDVARVIEAVRNAASHS